MFFVAELRSLIPFLSSSYSFTKPLVMFLTFSSSLLPSAALSSSIFANSAAWAARLLRPCDWLESSSIVAFISSTDAEMREISSCCFSITAEKEIDRFSKLAKVLSNVSSDFSVFSEAFFDSEISLEILSTA